MKTLAWNCRGLLSPTAIQELLDLQGRLRADVVFLSESHLNNDKAEALRVKLGFDLFHLVASDGRAGGLVLYYNLSNEVVLNYSSDNCIDGIVMDGNYPAWRIAGFYGEPSWERKHLSWTYLRDIHANNSGPWMVLGDFNEITNMSEKEGGNIRPDHYMREFRDCIDDCGLQEVMMIGDTFTWSRGAVRERLDRALCNEMWAEKIPYAALVHEHHTHSDHRPILLDTEYFKLLMRQQQNRKRMFEARCLDEGTVNEIINSAWERAKLVGLGPSLADRTKAVLNDLHEWDRETLKSPKKRINKLKKDLEKIRRGPNTIEVQQKMEDIQVLIENLLDQEELI
ncbi:uncharacterized protein [Aegilops tauschii subsp. strangulata]|uniref:uncharacterized protein n=1 Tax=Aegilops tauschii subsp. strangulata TaxID=200361 RepID=UPI003CC84193